MHCVSTYCLPLNGQIALIYVQNYHPRFFSSRCEPVDTVGIFKNLEPRTGQVLATIPASGKLEVDRAVKCARYNFFFVMYRNKQQISTRIRQ